MQVNEKLKEAFGKSKNLKEEKKVKSDAWAESLILKSRNC